MATELKPYLKDIRTSFGKKLAMPAYQEVNAQDFAAQIDRIPTPADGSIETYKGPFMVNPSDHVQTIQLENKYVEANVSVNAVPQYDGPTTVTPTQAVQTLATAGKQVPRDITINAAPPSGVEIKSFTFSKSGTLKSNKYIIPLFYSFNNKDLVPGTLNVHGTYYQSNEGFTINSEGTRRAYFSYIGGINKNNHTMTSITSNLNYDQTNYLIINTIPMVKRIDFICYEGIPKKVTFVYYEVD